MIDLEMWWESWRRICRRFAREPEREDAAEYAKYLNDHGYDTARALAAAEQVWATREFFPRPADFIAGEAAVAWPVLLEMSKLSVHIDRAVWQTFRDQVSDRAWQAIADLGGTKVISESRDLLRTRQAFQRSFEAVVIKTSQQLAAGAVAKRLGIVPEQRQLAPGGEVSAVIKPQPKTGKPERVRVELGGG